MLNDNALQVLTSLNSVGSHLASGILTNSHFADGKTAAQAGAAQAAACGATLEAQAMNQAAALFTQIQTDAQALYALIKQHSDVFNEVHGIT